MKHQPLTKAERDNVLSASSADGYYAHDIRRLCADLDAAEAERDEIKSALGVMGATRERVLEVAGSQDALEERIESMRRERDVALSGWSAAEAARDAAAAQRDRAESELAAERRMRVEAEAASDRLMAERDALIRNINDAFLSLNIPNSTMAFDGRNLLPHAVESARYAEEMRIERDKALADVAKYVDRSESFASAIDHLVSNTADGTDLARITKERDDFRDGMVAMLVAAGAPVDLDAMEAAVLSAGKKPSDFISQRIRVLTAERDALWVDHRDVVDERDALKAKLDDPRRVLIHETEVVATKEEIAKLKKELADLSEADEELHACRALVNATSENLSVDLERMVDDLAEANEKAARSEKDAHSWCELYTDTKAKLAALVEAVSDVCSRGMPGGDSDSAITIYKVEALLRAAIAAARGGAS